MSDSDEFLKDPSAFIALTKIHKSAVLDCCFSPDSDQILTGSEDSTLVLWDLPPLDTVLHDETINDEHKLVCYRLSDHKSPVMSVAMHRKLFLSAAKDGQVKLWRILSDQTTSCNPDRPFIQDPSTYSCHSRVIRSVCFSPDAHNFATAADDQIIKIWSTECRNKNIVSFHDGHTNWIKKVCWSRGNNSLLASCGLDGRICIWDARTKIRQPPHLVVSSKRMQFNCLDWHPVFDHHIATGASDTSCIVWDLRNKKRVQIYLDHAEPVNSVAFNSGGSLLLSGSKDKTSRIFDVCEGRNLFTLKSHTAQVTSVCFNETGNLFATASQDKTVTVWKRNFETINIVYDDASEGIDENVAECYANVGSSVPVDYRHGERSQPYPSYT